MILCCGEALIDMLPRETTAGEAAFVPYPGGAVFNTAIALGRLGVPTGLYSGISNDLFGQMLDGALADAGVETSLCARSDAPSTLAFVQLIEGQARYAFYDENTALRNLKKDGLPPLPPQVTTLFFGGISLVSEPCGAAFEALMTRSIDQVTMLDPNIRPGFIRSESAYRARIGRMMAMADILKLSDEDLHWLQGDGEIAALAKRLLTEGPKIVIITEGAKGATAYRAGGEVHAPARQVAVADTVGAGDTFNAGFLAALHGRDALRKELLGEIDEETLSAALALGTEAAAVTVSRAGANPPWGWELP